MSIAPTTEVDGHRIRELRVRRGWSQGELADAVGVGAPHISRIERAERAPAEHLAYRIADALGVDPAAFITNPIPEVEEVSA